MHRIAVFPGTFDPVTFGHINLIKRAATLVDTLFVAVAKGHHKSPLLSQETRLNLLHSLCQEFTNVKIVAFEGLLVDLLATHNAMFIVRGLRNTQDFLY